MRGAQNLQLDGDELRRDRNGNSGGVSVGIFAKQKNMVDAGYK
jgi:hypothetical protein